MTAALAPYSDSAASRRAFERATGVLLGRDVPTPLLAALGFCWRAIAAANRTAPPDHVILIVPSIAGMKVLVAAPAPALETASAYGAPPNLRALIAAPPPPRHRRLFAALSPRELFVYTFSLRPAMRGGQA